MSDAKTDWLFSGVVETGNLVLPRDPFQLGSFEITRRLEPFPGVEDRLRESLASYGFDTNRTYWRMSTNITDCTHAEARREGTLFAREALALFRNANAWVEHLRLLDAGYLIRMSDQAVFAFHAASSSNGFGMFAFFDDHVIHPSYILNLLMRMPPERFGEVGVALRRSTHWADLATHTEDLGQQLFMRWVAIECLARVNETETINGKIAAAARFPGGRYEHVLPANERAELSAVPGYRSWRNRVTELLDKLRALRNAIAHSAFRELDVRAHFNDGEIYLATWLLRFAYQGVQGLALNALERNIRTIAEMWDRFSECFLARRHISIARELTGTIIHRFEHPAEFDYSQTPR